MHFELSKVAFVYSMDLIHIQSFSFYEHRCIMQ